MRFVAALVKKLVLCAWLSSGALEIWRSRLHCNSRWMHTDKHGLHFAAKMLTLAMNNYDNNIVLKMTNCS